MTANQKIAITLLFSALTAGALFPVAGTIVAISTFFTLILASFGINQILEWRKTPAPVAKPTDKLKEANAQTSKDKKNPQEAERLKKEQEAASKAKDKQAAKPVSPKPVQTPKEKAINELADLVQKANVDPSTSPDDLVEIILENSLNNSEESWNECRAIIEMAAESRKEQLKNAQPVLKEKVITPLSESENEPQKAAVATEKSVPLKQSSPTSIPRMAALMSENTHAEQALIRLANGLKEIGIDQNSDQASTENIFKQLEQTEFESINNLVKISLNHPLNARLTKETFFQRLKDATEVLPHGKITAEEASALAEKLIPHIRLLKGAATRDNTLEATQDLMNTLKKNSFTHQTIHQYSHQKNYDAKDVFFATVPLAIAAVIEEGAKKEATLNERDRTRVTPEVIAKQKLAERRPFANTRAPDYNQDRDDRQVSDSQFSNPTKRENRNTFSSIEPHSSGYTEEHKHASPLTQFTVLRPTHGDSYKPETSILHFSSVGGTDKPFTSFPSVIETTNSMTVDQGDHKHSPTHSAFPTHVFIPCDAAAKPMPQATTPPYKGLITDVQFERPPAPEGSDSQPKTYACKFTRPEEAVNELNEANGLRGAEPRRKSLSS